MTDPTPPKLAPSQLAGGVVVAIMSPALGSWIGAHLGDTGTIVGTAIGALVPAILLWLFLYLTYHTRRGLSRLPWRKAKPWHMAVAGGAVAVLGAIVWMGGLTGVEASVLHKSLAASVRHEKAGGTTFGGVVDAHAVRPAPSGVEPSVTVPASVTPTVVPSAAGLVPSPSPSASPSISPSAVPSGMPVTAVPSDVTPAPMTGATP